MVRLNFKLHDQRFENCLHRITINTISWFQTRSASFVLHLACESKDQKNGFLFHSLFFCIINQFCSLKYNPEKVSKHTKFVVKMCWRCAKRDFDHLLTFDFTWVFKRFYSTFCVLKEDCDDEDFSRLQYTSWTFEWQIDGNGQSQINLERNFNGTWCN